MKRCVALMMLVLVAVPFARADEASKKAKVQELFSAMHMERITDQILDAISAQVKQMTAQVIEPNQLTDAQKKIMADNQEKIMAMVREFADWKTLEPQYVTLYASTYSEEEIDGILSFYKSPVGQAMLAKTPELTAGAMQIAQARMGNFQPMLKASMDKMASDIAKAAQNAPPPTKKSM